VEEEEAALKAEEHSGKQAAQAGMRGGMASGKAALSVVIHCCIIVIISISVTVLGCYCACYSVGLLSSTSVQAAERGRCVMQWCVCGLRVKEAEGWCTEDLV